MVSSAFASETRFFVLANPEELGGRGGIYIAPLRDPEMIAWADQLVQAYREGGFEAAFNLSGSGTILRAEIARGSDGLNRDYTLPGALDWGWHVTTVRTHRTSYRFRPKSHTGNLGQQRRSGLV